MLFNSVQFILFFLIVYGLYLCLKHKWQNRMLLVASYIFYATWDWRFLSLIVLSTVLDYFCGIKIHESKDIKKKKFFLYLSITANLAVLGFFKYFNFFAENFQSLLSVFGINVQPLFLNIILPMGISFYTFQTMSYTIDIFRKELKPTKQFLDFALFVSFFPQLVAGPIERAKHLLPQMLKPRKITLSQFYEGCYLIFWGLFLKVCVADNLSGIVEPVFGSDPPYNGVRVLLSLYAFTIQIFCDFAGYSNVARGLGRVMGFDIMINFNLPFFVTNIQDFWNKWHISLSTWIRDYLYIPLFRVMRKVRGNMRLYFSLVISMTLIGLWHGASWNFVYFGVYYGILLSIYVVIRSKCHSWIRPKSPFGKFIWEWTRMIFMFHLVVFGMMLFRIQYSAQAYHMIKALLFNFTLTPKSFPIIFQIVFFSWVLSLVQFYQFYKKDLMAVYKANPYLKTAFYFVCFLIFIVNGVNNGDEFIYFQF